MSSGGVELDRPVASIRVGNRFRRDLGDLDELCASIEKLGLLQPITLTPDGTLVCGARRLAAVKRLGWDRVKVWITSGVSTRLAQVLAEEHENTIRKPFTPTEAAALYAELKQLYAADAARRQRATRFTPGGGHGGGDSPPPDGLTAVPAAGKARERAARAITGRDSSWSLERVARVQRLANDPATPESVREIARRELAEMDADGTINGHYLNVQAALSTDTLGRLADDPAQPETVRARAARELGALDAAQPPAELVKAAQAAIARATSDRADADAEPSTTPRLAAIKHYGLRAFVATIEEMDGWWRHYDPVEIAAGLSDDHWQQLRASLEDSTAFVRAIAEGRHEQRPGEQEDPPRAAGF